MAAVMGLGTVAWISAFGNYTIEEIKNTIIIINILAWGLQFVGHGVF